MTTPNVINYNLIRYEVATGTNTLDIFATLSRKYTSETIFNFLLELHDTQLHDIGVCKYMYSNSGKYFRNVKFPRFMTLHGPSFIGQYVTYEGRVVIINDYSHLYNVRV